MKADVILAIIQSLLTYGPKAIFVIAAAMATKDVSAQEIEALFITKKPEDYF